MAFLTRRGSCFRIGVPLWRKPFVHPYLLFAQKPHPRSLAFHPSALLKKFYVLIDLDFVQILPPIWFVILVKLRRVGLLGGIEVIGEVAIERGPVHLELD